MLEPPLVALIQTLLSAREPDEVRSAAAHGAMVVSPYRTLTIYELQGDGSLEPTLREGAEPGPGAAAVEELLAGRAGRLAAAVSTLDMFPALDERRLVDEYS